MLRFMRSTEEIGLQANWKNPGPLVLKYTRNRTGQDGPAARERNMLVHEHPVEVADDVELDTEDPAVLDQFQFYTSRPKAQQWHMIVAITALQKVTIGKSHVGGSKWRSSRTWALAFLTSPCSANTALVRDLKLLTLRVADLDASWLHLFVGFDALYRALTHTAPLVFAFFPLNFV